MASILRPSVATKLSLAVLNRKCLSTSSQMLAPISSVVVIGSGLMGSGITQVTAQSGQNVTLVDLNDSILEKAKKAIHVSLQRVAKKQFKDDSAKIDSFVAETMSRIKFSTNAENAVSKQCDLVIEAIIENIKIKQKLFASLDVAAPAETIFASNTSSLSISEIAEPTKRKDRFAGLHFFSPVPMMKLLEVIRIPETSDETHQKVMSWGQAIGKQTVTCKDTPGFIVNRLLLPYMAEAVRLLERGDATARDIDTAMKLGAGYPMGPFELMDFTGVDISKFVMDGWAEKYPDNPLFKPLASVNKLVEEGKLGMKTGEGWYKYPKK